ncbi:SAUR-like auxin-responsive protein family [Striga asiatica]|uniref:SAUR-like auxin-responsive protein family n=1 Tax=Striga asiatica TaxID=4170 RepID=A0A5A7R8B3_STRAF|nr:SAUR-like auxin-responsive protein family [Striga asiatica]
MEYSSSRKSSNKIRDIVRLQQMLKKWKNLAKNNTTTLNDTSGNNASSGTTTTKSGGIKFLKKTLSFSEKELSGTISSSSSSSFVPKGYVAVCVGKDELKRFVIPTEYLSHQVFAILLRQAEEEFGFQTEGVLKLPCHVELFEKILKMMEDNKSMRRSSSTSSLVSLNDEGLGFSGEIRDLINYSSHVDVVSNERKLPPPPHHHPQMCR